MKALFYSLAISLSIVVSSCTQDVGTVNVSYTKAIALYGDLDAIRQTPLVDQSRDIVNPGKIFVSGDLLIVGEEGEGVHVFDNSNPENPQNILFMNIPGNREFYVNEGRLYAETYYDMVLIDISTISQPVLVSRIENVFSPEIYNDQGEALIGFRFEDVTEKLDKNESYYELITQNTVNYFDYNDILIPESSVPASFAGNSKEGIGSVNRVAYYEDHVYVISKAFLSSFKDDGTLQLLSSERIGQEMETIFPHDKKLFIGTRNSMEVLDVSNPGQPQHITSFQHANACDPVYPVGEVAYVTLRAGDETETNCPGTQNALLVLDIKEINAPKQFQEVPMESPFGMTMIADKLYVGEGNNGLKVFDATDRLNLVLENWDKSIQAYDVISHPTRPDILLVAGPAGLNQYTIETDSRQLLSSVSF